jgi:hypothetical protein
VGALGEPLRENNLNHESSSLLIRRYKKYTGFTLQWFTHRNSMKKLNFDDTATTTEIHTHNTDMIL